MAPTANKRDAVEKQQTRLSFKNVRKNASASLKPSKSTLVTAAASKATTKLNESRKRATRVSDVSSIEPDDHEVEAVSEPEGTEPSFESPPLTPIEPLPLDSKDRKYSKLYGKSKAQQNNLPIIHGGNETKFVTILRTFDLSCEYGPCVGVSRLERWERAKDMGLDPPQEIYDILTSREGLMQETLAQCVFYERGV